MPTTGNYLVAGVDEVGRGPLAGPVVAAAVILDPNRPVSGLADSKKLSENKRIALADEIMGNSIAWAVASADVGEIDRLNILQASLLAMCRSINALTVKPGLVLVDGQYCPDVELPVQAIIKGDSKIPSISAASIIAKVTRDRGMVELDRLHPGYGFAIHKGYPTKSHILALNQLGVCPIHRRSFSPVKKVIELNTIKEF